MLEEQGATVEKRMQEIRARIDAEYTAAQSEAEAARKYTAFCVREDGAKSFFQLDRTEVSWIPPVLAMTTPNAGGSFCAPTPWRWRKR